MSEYVIESIDGVDMTPYIAHQGIKWNRADIESPRAGRDLGAEMHRGRVAIKERLDNTCRPLTQAEAQLVLQTIEPEFVNVTYLSPRLGQRTNVRMYSNNIPATFAIKDVNGTVWWMGITFPLIEK